MPLKSNLKCNVVLAMNIGIFPLAIYFCIPSCDKISINSKHYESGESTPSNKEIFCQ